MSDININTVPLVSEGAYVYTCEPNRYSNRSRTCWDGVNCAELGAHETLANMLGRGQLRRTRRSRDAREPLVRTRLGSVFINKRKKRSSVQIWTGCWQVRACERCSLHGAVVARICRAAKLDLKEDAWSDVGCATNQPVEECRNKIVCVLSSYRREKSKENNTKGTEKRYQFCTDINSTYMKANGLTLKHCDFYRTGTRRGRD
ncbi:hypothetical protein PR048_013641 [Dryococelus australis]|uniref:Uncharacterized protein n=1 Tax=Dryococelus australis TaxID=614101 RepID=A0ABQ9HSW5_9NEOP|nr:hypothetical protein PR048_013641 [Dryococelus australis]